jgi:stage IV sporulation protein B
LKGLFLKTSNEVGNIVSNTTTGIKGQFVSEDVSEMFKDLELTEIALRKEVRVGDAYIYTTIDGNTPKLYDIEIVKTNHVNSYGNKCMVIRITDKELLSKTGGIVQGMSGSPILQNGKLVGCITHVFINDPSKGFADFIDLEK